MLNEDPKLLAITNIHRCGESLEAITARFATANTNADKAFAQLRMDIEYREKHDLVSLSALPARKVFPSAEAQVRCPKPPRRRRSSSSSSAAPQHTAPRRARLRR